MSNLAGANNFRVEKPQPHQGTSGTLSHKMVMPLVLTSTKIGNKKMEKTPVNKKLDTRAQATNNTRARTGLRVQPENAKTPRLQINVPLALNSRQIENKKLEDNHMNINKKLNARAQAAKEAAERTRLRLHQARLIRQTETSRPCKEVTPNNVRYLDSIDGVEYRKEMKREQAAKMQAAWMVSDPESLFT
mmetsp:Transcript_34988/g.41767  ORF Transcript_34988/g.41767 Transcript_34988/m.41767 type:complete len:190 (+) Transcript_34988:112-681(+)